MPASPNDRWPPHIKALHWTLVLAILVEIPAGFLMSFTYGPSFRDAHILALHNLVSQIHHTAGFLILAAACAWVAIRLFSERPGFPSGMPRWQGGLARGVQSALLALLILIPWSGWTALSALEDSARFGATHIWFFGSDGLVPRIWRPLSANDPHGYARFARLHVRFLIAAGVIVALHIGSAAWHHFVLRDRILGRMWPDLSGAAPNYNSSHPTPPPPR
jgi:cytochrome b561